MNDLSIEGTCQRCAVPASQLKPRSRALPQAWPETENDPRISNGGLRASSEGQKRGPQLQNMQRCQSTVDLTGLGGFSRLYEPEPSSPLPDEKMPLAPVQANWQPSETKILKSSKQAVAGTAPPRAPLGEITNSNHHAAPAGPERPAEEEVPVAPELPNQEQYVTEYASDVLKSMLHRQMHFMPRPDYMAAQKDLNAKMRSILNDWLFEVHKKYGLRRETLFLSVNIIDRFLSRRPAARDRLQLVGVAATLAAAKFEEIHPPEVNDLIYVTACTYTRQDIIDMEMSILIALSFQVAGPSAAHFLSHFQAARKTLPERSFTTRNPLEGSPWEAEGGELAWYILELALLDIRMIRHAPSHLAASAVLLSNAISGCVPAWPDSLARASGHPEGALRTCVGELRDLLTAAPTGELQAVQNHYRRGGLVGERGSGGSGRR